jgi:predicted dehydrogenase
MALESSGISRRKLLARGTKTAAGVVATTALASCTAPQPEVPATTRVIGANDRINIAVIGTRGRGKAHLREFAKIPNVRVKTVCDVDERLFPERVKMVADVQGHTPGTEYDLRRVLDDKDIDAVATATPNHWHALVTIWACQASKHVYVEKPASYNVFEGRKMVEAASKYNRIVAVGFQSRSHPNVQQAMKFLHEGGLGDIYMAKGLCYKPRHSFGIAPNGPVPEGVHYDLWLGPAAYQPFNEKRFHYNWHWHWNTGNGDIGNQGVHEMDIARWGLGKNEHPVKVSSSGGYYKYTAAECSQETPNTQTAVFEYADGKILQFEVRGLYTNAEQDVRIGALFFGTEGWMHLNSSGKTWATFLGKKNEPGPTSEAADPSADPSNLTSSGGGGHFENFIAALRSGKEQDLTANIEGGHLSAALPHLANISYRLGRNLVFNGAKEKFVADKEADRMLTRKYRKPYVVPEQV